MCWPALYPHMGGMVSPVTWQHTLHTACHPHADLGPGEVVGGAAPGGRGRGQARVHKVQPDPANVGVGLVQGVLACGRRIVRVGITYFTIV